MECYYIIINKGYVYMQNIEISKLFLSLRGTLSFVDIKMFSSRPPGEAASGFVVTE